MACIWDLRTRDLGVEYTWFKRSRENYKRALVDYLLQLKMRWWDSKRRLHTNPLRILIVKTRRSRYVGWTPCLHDSLDRIKTHFDQLTKLLDVWGICRISPRLVRGLDYNQTVFGGLQRAWVLKVLFMPVVVMMVWLELEAINPAVGFVWMGACITAWVFRGEKSGVIAVDVYIIPWT